MLFHAYADRLSMNRFHTISLADFSYVWLLIVLLSLYVLILQLLFYLPLISFGAAKMYRFLALCVFVIFISIWNVPTRWKKSVKCFSGQNDVWEYRWEKVWDSNKAVFIFSVAFCSGHIVWIYIISVCNGQIKETILKNSPNIPCQYLTRSLFVLVHHLCGFCSVSEISVQIYHGQLTCDAHLIWFWVCEMGVRDHRSSLVSFYFIAFAYRVCVSSVFYVSHSQRW